MFSKSPKRVPGKSPQHIFRKNVLQIKKKV